MKNKAMLEIANFCECCPSRECCLEKKCVLFRIEKIIETIKKKKRGTMKKISYSILAEKYKKAMEEKRQTIEENKKLKKENYKLNKEVNDLTLLLNVKLEDVV